MEIKGSYLLPCSPDTAWAALNDPDVLKASLKGCEALEKTSDTEFSGKVAAKIGPVSARFSGVMKQTEVDAPHSCRMVFEGQGGVAGFAKGSALVTLAAENGGTLLSYVAETQIGGKLAQMGSRLVEGTAKSMAEDFFGKFAVAVQDASGDVVAASDQAAASPASVATEPPAGAPANRHWLILLGIVVVAVALSWILLG